MVEPSGRPTQVPDPVAVGVLLTTGSEETEKPARTLPELSTAVCVRFAAG